MLFKPVIRVTVFAIIGYGFAAASCMGLMGLASYFYAGAFFMNAITVLALIMTIFWIKKFKIGQRDLKIALPIFSWVLIFSLFNFILMVANPGFYADLAFKYLVSTILILFSCILLQVLSKSRRDLDNVSTNIFLIGFILSALAVIIDPIVNIRSMVPTFETNLYERTRAGGFYLQPNIAGAVLPIYFAMLVPRLSRVWLIPLAMLLVLASVLTFSRSSMGLTAIVLTAAMFFGRIPIWPMLLASPVLFIFGADLNIVDDLKHNFNIDGGSGLVRLQNLVNFTTLFDVGRDLRVDLAADARREFLRSPIVGYGPGYSWAWADRVGQGTHNIYLRHMLEYGFLGILIWTTLMWLFFKLRQPLLPISWAVTIFAMSLVVGLFSHNLTEQSSILLTLAAAYFLPMPRREYRNEPPL